MRKRIYSVAVAAVAASLAVAGLAQATGADPAINSVHPGVEGKTLTVHRINRNVARLTITAANGEKESIVAYGGDIRLSLAMAGVVPPGGTNLP